MRQESAWCERWDKWLPLLLGAHTRTCGLGKTQGRTRALFPGDACGPLGCAFLGAQWASNARYLVKGPAAYHAAVFEARLHTRKRPKRQFPWAQASASSSVPRQRFLAGISADSSSGLGLSKQLSRAMQIVLAERRTIGRLAATVACRARARSCAGVPVRQPPSDSPLLNGAPWRCQTAARPFFRAYACSFPLS